MISNTFLSGIKRIDSLLGYTSWESNGTENVQISYSFPFSEDSSPSWNTPYSKNNEPAFATGFGIQQQQVASLALSQWSNVANISFVLVPESAEESGAIRFAFTNAPAIEEWWGYAYPPESDVSRSGDVWINSKAAYFDWSLGYESFSLLSHEIGHAIGLKHPFSGAYQLPAAQDSMRYTLMSYDAPTNNIFRSVTGNEVSYVSIFPSGPMLYDVAAIQFLYGSNESFNAADTIYAFDPNSPFFMTIWDGGGNDLISVEGFSHDCLIDLRPGNFSNIAIHSDPLPSGYVDTIKPTYDGTQNLAIAYGAIIENATGGNGNDLLIGNNADNTLIGGQGNDSLLGGKGHDSLWGGGGNDIYWIDDLEDVVSEAISPDDSNDAGGIDTVFFSPNNPGQIYKLPEFVENLTLDGKMSAGGIGNMLDNVIHANKGNNFLDGADGNDTLSYEYSSRGIKVSLADQFSLPSPANSLSMSLSSFTQIDWGWLIGQRTKGSGSDQLVNFENLTGSNKKDSLSGNGNDNTLSGLSGNDRINGGDGNDAISGGGGKDFLTGGLGSDSFIFDTALSKSNVDRITDFTPGEDIIVLSASVFLQLESGSTLMIDDFSITNESQLGHDTFVLYDLASGALYFDLDRSGPNQPVPFAFLETSPDLSASDFLIV